MIKKDDMWGSTPAISYLAPTGQLQSKMGAEPIHRKSSPAILLNVSVQSLRRESIV